MIQKRDRRRDGCLGCEIHIEWTVFNRIALATVELDLNQTQFNLIRPECQREFLLINSGALLTLSMQSVLAIPAIRKSRSSTERFELVHSFAQDIRECRCCQTVFIPSLIQPNSACTWDPNCGDESDIASYDDHSNILLTHLCFR